MRQLETTDQLLARRSDTLEQLPLDYTMLRQLLQQHRAQDLSITLYGRPAGAEETAILEKIEQVGIRSRIIAAPEKKMVVKLRKQMKFVVLKIEDRSAALV